MNNIFDIIISIYLYFFIIVVGYLYILAFVGLFLNKRNKPSEKSYRFLILVPAHNESENISKTINSLLHLEQIEHSTILVIADNCTDNTAEVAKSHGVEVLERFDKTNRGKGYALEYAISQKDLHEYDAVLVVDSDTVIDSNALLALRDSFESGYGAAQLNNCLHISEDTALSQLQQIANRSENNLFYKPRAILRLPILLRGTGMAITSETLQQYPWDSHSVTEDVDYAVNLNIKNIKIDYIADSSVYSPATSSYDQSYTQKMRWASGTFAMISSKFMTLIKEGFKQLRFGLFELAFSLLTLSRPSLVYALLISIPFILLLPVTSKLPFIVTVSILNGLIIVYILIGFLFVPDKSKALKGILQIPKFAFWFLIVQIKAVLNKDKAEWNRTDRK